MDIAEIEAARDVDLATIHAETVETIAEADAAENEDDIEWLREKLTGFETSFAMHAGELSALRQQVETQQQALNSLTETMTAQAAAILLLTPPLPLTADEASLSEGEAGPEMLTEQNEVTSEEEAAPPVRRRGWLR